MAAADASHLQPETLTGGIRSERALEDVSVGGEDGRATQRTRLTRLQPRVHAEGVERVAAQREEPELVVRLEPRQADGAVGGAGGGGCSASDGGEGEQRERIDERLGGVLRSDSAGGEPVRFRLEDGGGRGGGGGGRKGIRARRREVTEAAAVEEAEEEAEGDGGDDGDGEDEDDDQYARAKVPKRRRRRVVARWSRGRSEAQQWRRR